MVQWELHGGLRCASAAGWTGSQAGSGREGSNLTGQMAVTLARRQTGPPTVGRRRRPQLMEKFVIEGGVALSGTMVPAGNKNAALPILASSVLTEDEVVVRNRSEEHTSELQ